MLANLKLTAFVTNVGTIIANVDTDSFDPETAEIEVYDACIVTKAPKKLFFSKDKELSQEDYDKLLNSGNEEELNNVRMYNSSTEYEDVYNPIIADTDVEKTHSFFNLNSCIIRWEPTNNIEIQNKINAVMGRSKIVTNNV